MAENPVGYLPDVQLQPDMDVAEDHLTQILRAPSGREQRRAMFPTSGFQRWRGLTGALTLEARRELYDFLKSKRGQFGAFYAFRPDYESVVDFLIGGIVNAQYVLLPFKDSVLTAAKVNGVSQPFTFAPGAGPGGEDAFNFTAPQSGTVTVTLTGRRRIVARSAMDSISWQFIESAVLDNTVFEIQIQGLGY